MFGLSRVTSLDLIDLDAHVGTRVLSVLGGRVADSLDLRRGPAADSTCCKEGTARVSDARSPREGPGVPADARLGRVPQLCGSQGYRAVSRPA